MRKIRILLVDDQKIFIESLKTYLEESSREFQIVGLAADGRQALEIVERELPDIILMDVRMPIIDGVEATKEIHNKHPEVKILMLTTFDDNEYLHTALEYGAAGYLLKEDIDAYELLDAIKAALSGSVLFSPKIATKLLRPELRQGGGEAASTEQRDLPDWFFTLSKKERKILHLILEGYDNRDISEQMYLVEQTIKNYISIIYSKLGTHDRMQTIRKARDIKDYLVEN
jgi:DNA-binding NarL/FixJ family response regulator